MLDAGGLRAISVSIEGIRDIATKTLADIESKTSESTGTFTSYRMPQQAFSSYPLAQDLGLQHEFALELFKETIKGVLSDLATFQSTIIDSANSYSATDDAAAASFSAFNSRLSTHAGHQWKSTTDWQDKQEPIAEKMGVTIVGSDDPESGVADNAAPPPDQNSDTPYS